MNSSENSAGTPESKPEKPPKQSILGRLDEVEEKQRGHQLVAALRAARRKPGGDPAAEDFREELFDELRKLIPVAIAQAKKGKPALLRILARYSR